MKEQLISFKTAKLAKEKGFDVDVLNCYYVDGTLIAGITYNNSFYANFNINDDKFSAPTQSLLQKWLREKHNSTIEISINCTSKKWCRDFVYNINNPDFYLNGPEFNTYEEALESGLIKLLKLIK